MYIKKEDQAATVRQTVMGGKGEILSRIFLDSKDAAGAGRLFAVNTIARAAPSVTTAMKGNLRSIIFSAARRKSWTRGRSTSCMPAI